MDFVKKKTKKHKQTNARNVYKNLPSWCLYVQSCIWKDYIVKLVIHSLLIVNSYQNLFSMSVRPGSNYPLHHQWVTNNKSSTPKKSYCAQTCWSAPWDEREKCNRLVYCQKLFVIKWFCIQNHEYARNYNVMPRRDKVLKLLALSSRRLKWTFFYWNLSVVVIFDFVIVFNFTHFHFHLLLKDHFINFNQAWHKTSFRKGIQVLEPLSQFEKKKNIIG